MSVVVRDLPVGGVIMIGDTRIELKKKSGQIARLMITTPEEVKIECQGRTKEDSAEQSEQLRTV